MYIIEEKKIVPLIEATVVDVLNFL